MSWVGPLEGAWVLVRREGTTTHGSALPELALARVLTPAQTMRVTPHPIGATGPPVVDPSLHQVKLVCTASALPDQLFNYDKMSQEELQERFAAYYADADDYTAVVCRCSTRSSA